MQADVRQEEVRSVVELQRAAEAARRVADAAQADYVDAVKAAVDAGVSVAELAAATGLTRTGIYQACRRRRATRWGTAPRKTDAELVAERRADRARDLAEYRIERHRQELERDERTGGYAGDIAHEKATGVAQPITYRDWMRANREGEDDVPELRAARVRRTAAG